MIRAYIEVVRDRASDRGCTGGSEGAIGVGPPGEIPGGVLFLKLAICFSAFFWPFFPLGFWGWQITVDGFAGGPPLVGFPCVPLYLFEAAVAADGGDLMHRASRIRHPPAGRLA